MQEISFSPNKGEGGGGEWCCQEMCMSECTDLSNTFCIESHILIFKFPEFFKCTYWKLVILLVKIFLRFSCSLEKLT